MTITKKQITRKLIDIRRWIEYKKPGKAKETINNFLYDVEHCDELENGDFKDVYTEKIITAIHELHIQGFITNKQDRIIRDEILFVKENKKKRGKK